ncbi:MAG: signal peptidase I [Proteobacteria bacterium]|nr:signal peptidase I [Pseudomonadota bacterium]MDA0993415.1 signal peptidase I [Pseudomonadota bacterium]
MSINLALILVLLTAVSGAVVAFNRFYYANKREVAGGPDNAFMDTMIEYSRSFFPVLLFVLVIRSFIFEPFRIPSGSMMPTLIQGDFIFVKKYSFGLRWPVIEKKFIETGSPKRGDVVVFRLPSNPKINYIKRVVGLPGDVIAYDGARLTINGQLMPVADIADGSPDDAGHIYSEVLGNREHLIRHRVSITDNPKSRVQAYEIPDGYYFMMGDNRDNSQDSRYIGAIPETHLVGEAVRIWMHLDLSNGAEWPDWGRIGTKIQ